MANGVWCSFADEYVALLHLDSFDAHLTELTVGRVYEFYLSPMNLP